MAKKKPKKPAKGQSLIGRKFGRLKVIKQAETLNKNARWECKCDCGGSIIILGVNLKRAGKNAHCGCRGGRGRRARKIEVDGEVLTPEQMADRAYVTPNAMRDRLRRGLTGATAIDPPEMRGTWRAIWVTFNGETLTASEWARRNKIKPDTVHARIAKLGWDVKVAVTKPAQRREKPDE